METLIQDEVRFYENANVMVTQSRYVTNSKTYAIRNISSVHLFEIVKNRTFPVIIMMVGILMLFSNEARIVGLFMSGIGVLILLITKNEYAVRISTNSGETNSVVSKDKQYIQEIVEALNNAIIYRT